MAKESTLLKMPSLLTIDKWNVDYRENSAFPMAAGETRRTIHETSMARYVAAQWLAGFGYHLAYVLTALTHGFVPWKDVIEVAMPAFCMAWRAFKT